MIISLREATNKYIEENNLEPLPELPQKHGKEYCKNYWIRDIIEKAIRNSSNGLNYACYSAVWCYSDNEYKKLSGFQSAQLCSEINERLKLVFKDKLDVSIDYEYMSNGHDVSSILITVRW